MGSMRPGSETGRSAGLAVIAFILVAAAITYLGPVLTPVLIALFLYYIIRPAADALVRRGAPAWLAYLFLFTLTVVAIIWLGRIVHGNMLLVRGRLPEYRANLLGLLDALPGPQARAQAKDLVAQVFDVSTGDVLGLAFGPAISFLETAVMVFFYLFFIIISARRIGGRVQRAFAPETAGRLLQIGSNINKGMAQYMKVKTLVSLGIAICQALIAYLFGLHFWPLWAVLMFALNYITYVGSIAALVPPVVLAFLQFGNSWTALGLAALLIINRFVWVDYIEIRLAGKSLNVDPVLLLASLAYWGWVWGAVGLVLAAPMLMALKITLANIESTRRWAVLISDE